MRVARDAEGELLPLHELREYERMIVDATLAKIDTWKR